MRGHHSLPCFRLNGPILIFKSSCSKFDKMLPLIELQTREIDWMRIEQRVVIALHIDKKKNIERGVLWDDWYWLLVSADNGPETVMLKAVISFAISRGFKGFKGFSE